MTLKITKNSYKNFISKTRQSKKYQILSIIVMSILLSCIIETLSRRSIIRGLGFIFTNPIISILNILIIFITLSLALLTNRKRLIFNLISTIWLIIGIINFIIMSFRLTPLSIMDLYEFTSTVKIIPISNTLKILILIIVIIVITVLIVKLWKKSSASKPQIKLSLIIIGIAISLFIMFSSISRQMNILTDRFDNLHDAYMDYGFTYCLSITLLDHGIKKPSDYSKERINEIINTIEHKPDSNYNNTIQNPNIIMVQLESFFDVNNLKDYTFSENPIPNFTNLRNEFSTGYLTVPSLGAGTVNTEFEVLTGMNTDFFGKGEYPYRTILQSSTSESICTNLEELGYHSTAIHNNIASFYRRNEVYGKLGFDNFDSIENMNNIEYNPIGWAKDKVLTDEILNALNAVPSTNDFIYAISVQSHGEYLTEKSDKPSRISVLPSKDASTFQKGENYIDESYINQLEYYVNQLSETDKFIGDLTGALSVYEEPTVVVFFGDHLPPLSLDDDDLTQSKYQTEYILWSNYSMENVRTDLTAYQLNAYLLSRIGIDNGILTKFHQSYSGDAEDDDDFKLLQYDMLYGKKYVYGGENPYLPKETVMGIHAPTIINVSKNGEKLSIEGENFTPWSVIYIDDKSIQTEYINSNTLYIPYKQLSGKRLFVAQVSDSKNILSKSKAWSSD